MKKLVSISLLSGVLALSACGTTPDPAPAPTKPGAVVTPTQPAQSLKLYELSMNGVGEKVAASSIRPAGGMGAQATEIGGLTFKSKNITSIADMTTGMLHLVATYTVTNNSGAAISVPTYIPVDTDGTFATQEETPFRNVLSRKGAPLSPAAITLERAHYLWNNAVQEDPNSSAFVTNLDTGALQLNLPAGTTAPGISHRGWQAGRLEAGASQDVNFAMRVKLQGKDVGDNDPFRFSLIFAVADNPGTVTLTNIASVQGSTPAGDAATPLNAQSVTVEGVVTSVTPGLSGFFVQEEGMDADADANTSNGVFVYCATSCPAVTTNSRVRVTGTAAEFSGATQLASPTVTVLATGVPAPAPIALTLPLDKTQLERYEGMRVSFPETLTVTNNYTYGRYGQLDLSNGGRIFNPTNGNAKTGQSTITLDDGISAQNPLNLSYLGSENTRRTGDTVTGLTGIWHAVANLPMLEPEGPVNFVSANSRAANAQPKDVGGSLKVGGANVLNYFTTYGSSADRGANNTTELQRQRTKMANNLVTLNADVLTLMEVQNNGDTALNDLVAALNEKAGAGTYAAVKTGTVGTDAIKVAVIYKPGKVTPVGQYMIDTNSVFSRPPVAQTFRDKATGGVFSVVANHFKSKGSCPASGDTDQGQGCWNNLRVQQATQLLNFVKTIQQTSGDQDVILLGDFNAYGAEDPIKTLQNGGFESLNLRISAEDRYSYQFNGQFGYLDHALASPNLSSQVTGITEWHVNSDEPVTADYNTEFKAIPECGGASTCLGKDLFDPATPFRASDHDPVLVGLNLTPDGGTTPTPPTTPTTPTTSLSASPAALTVTAGGAAATSTLTTSTQNYSGADLTISTGNSAGLSVTPSVTTVSPNGTFTVSVSAPAGTAAGTYPVTVTTAGDGGLTASTTINLTVGAGGTVTPPATGMNHLVISQVFGGGGNNGATLKNDFVELFNPTTADINLSGYAVEYFSKAGGSGGKTPLSGTIKAGGYFLIQEAAGTGDTQALPTPDATGTLAMSGTDGSVALSNASGTVDLVGYGAAAKVEGAATGALSSTNSAQRNGGGCVDTDNNKADFTVTVAAPRNSSSPLNVCQ
ncbi:ExeM/NucH family extracellular endonuclease [Deinococcus sp. VB343]|uniref:ExeM/NucH family extracellular endonuclease n=1 Tax=Deinococcus sp. VB343 TaxID=3385567 RepID=UPI0039C8EE3F